MASTLLIGRWQPFHDGHRALVQTVLDEGRSVCIGIRDTGVSPENPYTASEREAMIHAVFPRVTTVVIPDIDEVAYGRTPGWGIREIRLDAETEAISGTAIRQQADVTWITGNSGAGKTTLAKRLRKPGDILLDGDVLRTIWPGLTLSTDDRWEQNLRAARLAAELVRQGFNVIVSTICPFRALRAAVKDLTGCRFVYLDGGHEPSPEFPYEI